VFATPPGEDVRVHNLTDVSTPRAACMRCRSEMVAAACAALVCSAYRPAQARAAPRGVTCAPRSVLLRVAPRRAERAGWGGRTTRRRLAASKSSDSGAEPETPAAAETPAAEETTTDTATVPPAAEAASGDVIEFEVDASAPAKQSGLVDGVLEEAGRINWPPVGQVLGSTVLVLALVGSSAFLLLGLNSVLSTASAAIFD